LPFSCPAISPIAGRENTEPTEKDGNNGKRAGTDDVTISVCSADVGTHLTSQFPTSECKGEKKGKKIKKSKKALSFAFFVLFAFIVSTAPFAFGTDDKNVS
jgi:hypothetical protein